MASAPVSRCPQPCRPGLLSAPVKLLPGPYGWASYGELSHVTLRLIDHRPEAFDAQRIRAALECHSCYPPAIQVILSCLQHSLYQCMMRPAITAEVIRCGCLRRAGVGVSWHIFGTHGGTVTPQNTHSHPIGIAENRGPAGVRQRPKLTLNQ